MEKPDIVFAYLVVKNLTLSAGYGTEIAWQAARDYESVSETDFLREYAWVVLSAGMQESIVRRRFQSFSKCFCDWCSSKAIVEQESACRLNALACFNNRRKIDSILQTAHIIESLGFGLFKEYMGQNPLEFLKTLPYIGPVTCYHLAKNIGLPVAKPDRHLVRLANSMGYCDVQEFCRAISEHVSDSIPVVDIVLWRFATITDTYIRLFRNIAYEELGSPICDDVAGSRSAILQ